MGVIVEKGSVRGEYRRTRARKTVVVQRDAQFGETIADGLGKRLTMGGVINDRESMGCNRLQDSRRSNVFGSVDTSRCTAIQRLGFGVSTRSWIDPLSLVSEPKWGPAIFASSLTLFIPL